ncbi:MAG: ArnT family glycosyltransferase [Candidatus Nanoarchaeia archaeon]
MKKQKRLYPILLIALLLFHFANNAIYALNQNIPPSWDESWHTTFSFNYFYMLSNQDISIKDHYPVTYERYSRYPHLVQIFAVPFYFIFGLSENVALFTITFFFLLLILFTYLIGKYLYDEKIGFFSALLVSFYPIVFGISRIFLLDLPVVTMVLGTFYFLFKYSDKKNTRDLLFTGLFIILGAMTKQTYFIFVTLPILFVLYKTNSKKIKLCLSNKKYLFITITSILTIIVLFLIYLKFFSGIYLMKILFSGLSINKFLMGLLTISKNLVFIQIGAVCLMGFFISLIHFEKIKNKEVFIMWIIVPVLFLAFTGFIAGGRYLMPILPPIAIITIAGLFNFKLKPISYSVLFFMILILFYNFYQLTYGSAWLHALTVEIIPPKNQDWHINDLLLDVSSVSPNSKVFVAVNHRRFNIHNFATVAIKNNYNLTLDYYFNNTSVPDYIIIKTPPLVRDIDTAKVYRYIFNNSLETLSSYSLPDNSDAVVFINKK